MPAFVGVGTGAAAFGVSAFGAAAFGAAAFGAAAFDVSDFGAAASSDPQATATINKKAVKIGRRVLTLSKLSLDI
jgi:hypothetical protein